MKRVLVIGLSPNLGGVETFIYNMVLSTDISFVKYDFLIVGDKKSVFEDEILMYSNNVCNFYYVPNIKKHPIRSIKKLRWIYSNNNYDYIYLNTCTCAKILYCLFGLKKGTKLITHSHTGNGDSSFNNRVFRKKVIKKSSYLLSCSDYASNWLYGNKNKKDVIIIKNGVDVDRFKYSEDDRYNIRKKMNLSNDLIVMGNVGRFSPIKNQKFLIELAKFIPDNYVFLCIGEGETKKEFISKIPAELEKRFFVLDNQYDIERYYSAMDFFIMPSIYEGLPIVAVEAQACDLKCFFADTISRQTSVNDENVFLPLDNVQEWVDNILSSKRVRFNNLEKIKKYGFDMKDSYQKILDIFYE